MDIKLISGAYFFKPVVVDMIKQLKPSWRGNTR
jgi:dTDP-glucose pyrophosphorylase